MLQKIKAVERMSLVWILTSGNVYVVLIAWDFGTFSSLCSIFSKILESYQKLLVEENVTHVSVWNWVQKFQMNNKVNSLQYSSFKASRLKLISIFSATDHTQERQQNLLSQKAGALLVFIVKCNQQICALE